MRRLSSSLAISLLTLAACGQQQPAAVSGGDKAVPVPFQLEEATIAGIQSAILSGQITTVGLVDAYLHRIKAYNGTCVKQPQGILGPVTTIPNARQLNALSTLNLRPRTRKAMGFDDRKARSMTDAADDNPAMPDALEVAAELDRKFAETGELVGPLHGIPVAIKDQYDTFDMRTTSGADALYANDRPPEDATTVKRLREAGAIILAKANMGEYAGGDRSAFGGTFCNPYDTERSPGRSSGGSGSAVAANLVVCSIGEESGPSIRNPSKNNNIVGLAPTQELVSRHGMIPASLMNDRVGPMCRTVADAARVLDAIAGYDPKDELTAFTTGRMPPQPYSSFTSERSLSGLRIGVMREYMNPKLLTAADAESIAIVESGIAELRRLGAEIVDPGLEGTLCPGLKDIGTERSQGEGKYVLERYLKERGDAKIRNVEDLVQGSRFFTDIRPGSGFSDKKESLVTRSKDPPLDTSKRLQTRFNIQQAALTCFEALKLDALTYPTGNVPPPKLGAPVEPSVNGRSALAWTVLGAQGFPAITVPAGFTRNVFDRVADASSAEGTKLVGPVPAKLPVGIDFLGRPFSEPTLFRIAAAYESATHHRVPPPAFGPLKK